MNRLFTVALSLFLVIAVVGCAGQEPVVEDDWGEEIGPSWAHNPPTSPDTFYGVANARSQDLNTGIQRANLRATQQLAQSVGQSIESWQEDYVQEAGDAADSELVQSFESLVTRIVDEEIRGITEQERSLRQENGVFNVWIKVSVPVEEISEQFSEMERLEREFSPERARQELQRRINPGDQVAPIEE